MTLHFTSKCATPMPHIFAANVARNYFKPAKKLILYLWGFAASFMKISASNSLPTEPLERSRSFLSYSSLGSKYVDDQFTAA